MYNTSGATIRGDINIKVEEAAAADKFFIAQRVLPMVLVGLKSGSYPKLTRSATELLTPNSTIRNPKSEYARTQRAWTSDTYDCVDRGLEEPVDDAESQDIGRFFNAEVATARFVLRSMMLDYEIRVQQTLFSTTNFGAATAASVAYTMANIATINFPKDILDAIERVNDNGSQANTIVMSSTILNRLKQSTLLQNFIRGNRPNDSALNITAGDIQSAFADNGIENVYIGRARYNSAKKGQSYSAASVWGTSSIWVGEVQGGPADGGGAGRTFVWNDNGSGLFVTETYREDKIRSNIVRVRQNTAEKIVDGSAGTLINPNWA
jgi:hypothetical protein